jgi:hypothetical protein
MKLPIACVLLAVAVAGPVQAQTLRDKLGVGNAPPPPVVVYRDAPPIVVVPRTQVYVVRDTRCNYDFFRYGVYWFIWNDGYWYRSRSYRGPFRVIEERYVPVAIWNVPSRHWRHHPHGGPPGLAKKNHRHNRGHDYVARGKGSRHDDDD